VRPAHARTRPIITFPYLVSEFYWQVLDAPEQLSPYEALITTQRWDPIAQELGPRCDFIIPLVRDHPYLSVFTKHPSSGSAQPGAPIGAVTPAAMAFCGARKPDCDVGGCERAITLALLRCPLRGRTEVRTHEEEMLAGGEDEESRCAKKDPQPKIQVRAADVVARGSPCPLYTWFLLLMMMEWMLLDCDVLPSYLLALPHPAEWTVVVRNLA